MAGHWLTLHDPVDPSWWYPLERLATRVAADPDLPPVDPDDFIYAARIERGERPVLHVYRHVLTRRYLNVDEDVHLWRFAGSGEGGYARLDLVEALERAELSRAELLAARTRRGRRRPVGSDEEVGSEGLALDEDPLSVPAVA